jgi:hypothetical protein
MSGCGCKQNNNTQQKQQPVMVQEDNVINIIDIPQPTYSRENIIRIKDYLSSVNKTHSEKQFVSDLLLNVFGDIIPDYCDQNCFSHIRARINYMESKVLEYENFIKN